MGSLSTSTIWEEYFSELYFFTLKRVRQRDDAKEIIQNTFVKIHANLHQLKEETLVRPWIFQITRNEIVNFYKAGQNIEVQISYSDDIAFNFCCFDQFVDELPEPYRAVVDMVFFKGHKQNEVAKELGISLPNVKARIRRAKALLKQRFATCCNYEINTEGKLIGQPDCPRCD